MEVAWPSGIALRGEVLNRPHLHWLKTVVENVVGKGATRSRQVRVGKMSDGRKSSAVDVSKTVQTTSKPSKKERMSRSTTQSFLKHRSRQTATASTSATAASASRTPG